MRESFAPAGARGTDVDLYATSHDSEDVMGKKPAAEGDENQRRQAARDARAAGKLPSEVGATLGASKQTKSAKGNASHEEKLEQKHEGKKLGNENQQGFQASERPRPGNRETDPNREERRR